MPDNKVLEKLLGSDVKGKNWGYVVLKGSRFLAVCS